jgi:hypothetical protein
MTDLALLAATALAIGLAGPIVLRRQRWLERSPRLGVVMWMASLWSATTALLLTIALSALDSAPVRDLVIDMIRACVSTFHAHYDTSPIWASVALASLIMSGAALVAQTARIWVGIGLVRRRHRRLLDRVARPYSEPGVWIIDHPVPTAYCLPGQGGRVVVSSGALSRLTPDQTAGVIAHEKAHLAGHHHRVLVWTSACHRLLPFLPLARRAPRAIGYLLERLADDEASRSHPPHVLANAIRAMSTAPHPAAALGIAGGSAAGRIEHLAGTSEPASMARQALGWAVATAIVALPLVLAVGSALGIPFADHCPIPPPS